MSEVGKNIKWFLERELKQSFEGKCAAEGFIRPNSVRIVSYSAGMVKNENIEFIVVYECDICHPVEGMLVECVAKTITKAGIHAGVKDPVLDIEPITVFVARDHHFSNKYFSTIKEGAKITARIIGVRYELNDKCVFVIAEIVRPMNVPTHGRARAGGAAAGDEDSESDGDSDSS
jgi:DNA-directed RNA polymerase subunit E'/Rpb7